MSEASARDSAVLAQTLTWGQIVRGARWGQSAKRLLFIHEPGLDLDAWGSLPGDFARALDVEARAFDLPGHGLSVDPWKPELLPLVISELIRPQAPAGNAIHPIVIAAGESALATLQIADQLALTGLVVLSPHGESRSIPRSPAVPKLFVAGAKAGDDLDLARQLASSSGGWAVVTAVPVDARGTGLLETEWNMRVSEAIAAFARESISTQPAPSRKPSPPYLPLPLR